MIFRLREYSLGFRGATSRRVTTTPGGWCRPRSFAGAPSGTREGTIVGVQVQAHGLGQGQTPNFDPNSSIGRMVHLAFPLYFLRDQDGLRILRAAFNYVNASPTLP